MTHITDADRGRITAAIRAAEARTSGEFVAVVARRAADHLEFALLYALVIGAVVGLSEPWWGGWGRPSALQAALLVQLAIAALLLALPRLRLALVPRALRLARCRALAQQQFHAQGLARTRGRTGVLLFVAWDERYVEVIADSGIHAAVPAGFWDEVVAGFTARVRRGEVGDGFVSAIERIGAALAAHAPRTADDRNELVDRLFEI
jgi:putative membrane protein